MPRSRSGCDFFLLPTKCTSHYINSVAPLPLNQSPSRRVFFCAMMSIRLILSALVAASAARSHPGLNHRAAPQVVYGCVNPNQIALTFDDGPYIYLRQISDAFTAANASATFFMNGFNWACIYDLARASDVQYAYKAGHMVGSHTWGHTDLTADLTDAQITDQMYRMEEAFSRILGVIPAFVRPPYGDYNDQVLSIMSGRGQSAAMWDNDTGDADGNTVAQSEDVYNTIANSGVPNALILEHETEKSTAEQLVPYAINLFQGKGYKLVTLAECLGVSPYQAVGVPQARDATWTCNNTPAPGAACGGSIACKTDQVVVSTSSAAPTPTPTSA
ncbi:hypothetical protein B0H12DRAFT_1189527 [Mycena haematopus]|nr:hypothetical protein B0H12DRAFT_1189527 [Mycena haematopus]